MIASVALLSRATLAQVLWQEPEMAPVVVAVLAVMLAALLLLYPPQVRYVPRRWRWVLPGLRISAVAALAISIVQPAVLRPRSAAQQGAIIVLADRSRSMSVSDRGRSPAEMVSLAAGLGALEPGARKEALPDLRAQLDQARAAIDETIRARSEADYARISARGAGAAEVRLRDAAEALHASLRSLVAPAAATEANELHALVKKLKRPLPAVLDEASLRSLRADLDAAIAATSRAQAASDEKLFESDPVVRTACVRLGRSTRQNLMDRALTDTHAGLLANLPAGAPVVGLCFADDVLPIHLAAGDPLDFACDGARSEIGSAVRDAVRRMQGRAVQAVVVLSDGRQVSRATGPEASTDLSALGVPVFCVPVASAVRRQDVSVVGVDAPASARVGETIVARARLTGSGFAKQSIDVQLDLGDQRQQQTVTFGDDATASVEFDVKIDQSGLQQLVISALPLVDEVSDENNVLRRWIKVGEDPLRVTVVAGADAGKQYASLHDALSRAPWVALREVEEGQTSRLTAASVLSQDVIVLCDLPPEALSSEQWDSLDVFVRRRGGTVVMCAGAHLPAAYTSKPALADWLPYDASIGGAVWRAWPGGQAHLRVAPAPTILADQMLPLQDWQHLPAVSRLFAIDRPLAGVRPLLIERDSGAAVVTDCPRGAGRIVFVGTDETWRWRTQAGAADRSAFFTQLLRATSRLPYPAAEGNLRLDASNVAPEPYETITIRARVLTTEGTPPEAPTQIVRLMQGQDEAGAATLRNEGTSDGRYSGTLQAPSVEGDYTLRLEAPPEPAMEIPPAPVTLPLRVATSDEAEMADLSPDQATLRRIAQSSGGRVVPLDQLSALPRMLAEDRERQNALAEYPLWDSPYLFVFVLACLSAEWSLRKKFGLA